MRLPKRCGALLALAASVVGSSCSFFAVNGPPASFDPKTVDCTDSDVVPSIDSALGVLAIGYAGAGEVVVHATNDKLPPTTLSDHYELAYGLPLLIIGGIFLYAASRGTNHVEQCHAAKHGETTGCDGCPAQVP
jgi:hypothetical protein